MRLTLVHRADTGRQEQWTVHRHADIRRARHDAPDLTRGRMPRRPPPTDRPARGRGWRQAPCSAPDHTGRQAIAAPVPTRVQGQCPWRGRFLDPRSAAESGPETRNRALSDSGDATSTRLSHRTHYHTVAGRARACKALRCVSGATRRHAGRLIWGLEERADSATLQAETEREG